MNSAVMAPVTTDVWARAQAHDMQMVADRMVKKGLARDPRQAEELITEYLRYMTIVSENHGQIFAPSDAVDEVWHTHLLFTADYAEFCEKVVGTFLHHRPATDKGLMQPCYHQTIHALHARFGNASIRPTGTCRWSVSRSILTLLVRCLPCAAAAPVRAAII